MNKKEFVFLKALLILSCVTAQKGIASPKKDFYLCNGCSTERIVEYAKSLVSRESGFNIEIVNPESGEAFKVNGKDPVVFSSADFQLSKATKAVSELIKIDKAELSISAHKTTLEKIKTNSKIKIGEYFSLVELPIDWTATPHDFLTSNRHKMSVKKYIQEVPKLKNLDKLSRQILTRLQYKLLIVYPDGSILPTSFK